MVPFHREYSTSVTLAVNTALDESVCRNSSASYEAFLFSTVNGLICGPSSPP